MGLLEGRVRPRSTARCSTMRPGGAAPSSARRAPRSSPRPRGSGARGRRWRRTASGRSSSSAATARSPGARTLVGRRGGRGPARLHRQRPRVHVHVHRRRHRAQHDRRGVRPHRRHRERPPPHVHHRGDGPRLRVPRDDGGRRLGRRRGARSRGGPQRGRPSSRASRGPWRRPTRATRASGACSS